MTGPSNYKYRPERNRTQRKVWAPDEIARALAMRFEEHLSDEEIGRRLKRSAAAVYAKIDAEIYRKECQFITQGRASPEAISQRDARAEAMRRRSLTAAAFGDPPPGYSQLDKRGGVPL